jgi:Universal stress protein UspA and related nucleotide-binding proteins
MNHIIIALDFSENSPEVEKVGFEVAKKIGASVTLVSVINKFIDYVPVDSGQVFTSQWDARKAAALTSLEEVKNRHPEVETETVAFIGDPKDDIISISIEKRATFVVMGTHGRTGMSHFVTGSTAEYVIRHSVVPIIVVPINKERH